jgi:hypothetical protein
MRKRDDCAKLFGKIIGPLIDATMRVGGGVDGPIGIAMDPPARDLVAHGATGSINTRLPACFLS